MDLKYSILIIVIDLKQSFSYLVNDVFIHHSNASPLLTILLIGLAFYLGSL